MNSAPAAPSHLRHSAHIAPETRDRRTPEEIAADIERTRDRLEETLAALQRKLTPAALAGQAIKRVTSRSAPAGGGGSPTARAVSALIPLVMPGPSRPLHPSGGLHSRRRGAKPLTPGKVATALADAVLAALAAALAPAPIEAPPPRRSPRTRTKKVTRNTTAGKRRSPTKNA